MTNIEEFVARVSDDIIPAVPNRTFANSGIAKEMVRGERTWTLGELLGVGGFGRVHKATSGDTEAAVKLIPKSPGAKREVIIAATLAEEREGMSNIVPILDHGETAEDYFLVMPLASESLRARLARGLVLHGESLAILTDIATALTQLHDRVIHRDLKPENVLLLDEWCVSDFGISKHADQATATETTKFNFTPSYAAPEQWRYDTATAATDVYAWGIIAAELLTGAPPYQGPSLDDYREQHLHGDAPGLSTLARELAELIQQCVTKSASDRPTAIDILQRLPRSHTTTNKVQ